MALRFLILPKMVPDHTQINFIGLRKYAFTLSILLSLSTCLLLLFRGLNVGIDFAGGILVDFSYTGRINTNNLRQGLSEELGYHSFNVQEYVQEGSSHIMVRLQPKGVNHQREIDALKMFLNYSCLPSLQEEKECVIDFKKIDYIGPKVVNTDIKKAIQALVLVLIAMMMYACVRFDWQFGVGVVVALFHDILATLGFYSISGYEFDLTSVAAILTIVGYSINDSVVIYDRIRENMKKLAGQSLATIINTSINNTLSRTIMTVATTLLVCVILALFGGNNLRGFSVATCFGIAFGTYSSIYIAAPILLLISNRKPIR